MLLLLSVAVGLETADLHHHYERRDTEIDSARELIVSCAGRQLRSQVPIFASSIATTRNHAIEET